MFVSVEPSQMEAIVYLFEVLLGLELLELTLDVISHFESISITSCS